mgnify:CR=1 FL=1
MTQYRRILVATILIIVFNLMTGCAITEPKPLTYVALEKPKESIKINDMKANISHSRGGVYFLNYGFRPAAPLDKYLKAASNKTDTNILNNADVKLNIPFALDILFFGFQFGEDTVRVNAS